MHVYVNGYNGNLPTLRVRKATGDEALDTSIINQGSGSTQKKIERYKATLQSLIDEVVPLSEFPADDPYILNGDPATERIFYDGNGNIVFRNTLIEDVTISSEGRYILTLRSLDHG